ncbi:hypothetical protein PIB30_025161 [Stylosanthes scabra]|uniref:Uncharacterized protein n=1 Tax=Stylosanthes scabra TaxID=79078 RepID=A0ABU6YAI2_9FABA|nr:hypothetical protein [Stylosanthes scabra]
MASEKGCLLFSLTGGLPTTADGFHVRERESTTTSSSSEYVSLLRSFSFSSWSRLSASSSKAYCLAAIASALFIASVAISASRVCLSRSSLRAVSIYWILWLLGAIPFSGVNWGTLKPDDGHKSESCMMDVKSVLVGSSEHKIPTLNQYRLPIFISKFLQSPFATCQSSKVTVPTNAIFKITSDNCLLKSRVYLNCYINRILVPQS